MKMKNNDVKLTFKNNSSLKINELSKETLKNIVQDIHLTNLKIIQQRNKILKCDSFEKLNNLNIKLISDDIGLIIQNSVLIGDPNIRKSIEELNQLYRNLEIMYFDKKIELLDLSINKIEDTFKDSEETLKDITGGTLFSIASVFLGISLTSALVAGVEHINSEFIILYFITCLLIAIITIGMSAIFMRKFDTKSKVVIAVIIITSIVWIVTAILAYENANNSNVVCNNKVVEKKE